MAVYKVAQNVEAEDKLLGPFTFRQFIYLIIAALAGVLAWGLSNIFTPLFIIPLPVALLFGILALPLKKDQPMEVYLAALLSFFLKPRKRLWVPDGIESLVEITAPKVPEVQRTKDITGNEAAKRLSYLADIVDTEGWAIRRTTETQAYAPGLIGGPELTEDILDDYSQVAQTFNDKMTSATQAKRQALVDQMRQSAAAPPPPTPPPVTQPTSPPAPTQPPDPSSPPDNQNLVFNPYPESIKQSVIHPISSKSTPTPTVAQPAPVAPESTSETTPNPDIIKLANNKSLSVSTIAKQAERINKKQDDGEVFISLR